MALTSGAISLVKKYTNKIDVSGTAATGGTGPYTYQWYISKTSGFSPDVDSLVSGATSLQATLSGLIPGQQYYVKLVSTDTGASGATVTSDQLAVQTDTLGFDPNTFDQSSALGHVDLLHSTNTISVIAGEHLVTGQAVKWGSDGRVHACTANTDRVDGFIALNPKKNFYENGDACEIARAGSYVVLRATSSLSAGDAAAIDPSCIGGITAVVSTEPPCAQATKTVSAGELVVAYVVCPAL